MIVHLVLIILTLLMTETSSLGLSMDFPSLEIVTEFSYLSYVVDLKHTCYDNLFPETVDCHWFENKHDGTQVMVVSSDQKKYISVIWAGSNQPVDWIIDLNINLVSFGPEDDPIEQDVTVHEGFNHQVFSNSTFDTILDLFHKLMTKHPDYDLYCTGHSLGASDSTLTAGALAKYIPNQNITNISFGTPNSGSEEWKVYINSFQNLGVWHYVYRHDIVPRLLNTRITPKYFHCGHTIQMEDDNFLAYFLHYGKFPVYESVPLYWTAEGFIDIDLGWDDHSIWNYFSYFVNKSAVDPETYWSNDFVKFQLEQSMSEK